jgi:hypothetical protein
MPGDIVPGNIRQTVERDLKKSTSKTTAVRYVKADKSISDKSLWGTTDDIITEISGRISAPRSHLVTPSKTKQST